MGMVVLSVFGVLARQVFSVDTILTLLGKLKQSAIYFVASLKFSLTQ